MFTSHFVWSNIISLPSSEKLNGILSFLVKGALNSKKGKGQSGGMKMGVGTGVAVAIICVCAGLGGYFLYDELLSKFSIFNHHLVIPILTLFAGYLLYSFL